jgi:hypothetical protein
MKIRSILLNLSEKNGLGNILDIIGSIYKDKSTELLKELDRIAKMIYDEDDNLEYEGLNRHVVSFCRLFEEKVGCDILSKDDMIEKAKEIDDIFEKSPEACFEWQKKHEAVKGLKRLVKRAVIGIIKEFGDREAFASEVIEYAESNYYKG